ncbi:hypothetical protein [Synechococcus sp. M16CYN]
MFTQGSHDDRIELMVSSLTKCIQKLAVLLGAKSKGRIVHH